MNPKRLAPQKLFDYLGGEIASLNPDDLGGRTQAFGKEHEIKDERIGCTHEIVIRTRSQFRE